MEKNATKEQKQAAYKKISFKLKKYIEKHGFQKNWKCNIGKNETQILNEIENTINYKIKRQYTILHYVVDGYCEEMNIVYEIDEKYHLTESIKEKDLIRQQRIEEKLGCKFIRIKDY